VRWSLLLLLFWLLLHNCLSLFLKLAWKPFLHSCLCIFFPQKVTSEINVEFMKYNRHVSSWNRIGLCLFIWFYLSHIAEFTKMW
jgi:hypothetical protein